jgi:hypothetical protein
MTRYQTIAEYMNVRCKDRKFTALDVGIINQAVRLYQLVKPKNLPRTRKIFDMNNQNVSQSLDSKYTPDHIKLYKKCVHLEYEYRTGRSANGWRRKG